MSKDDQAIFSQTDPRWNRITLGQSPYTIGGYGCTITSVSRICFLLTGKVFTPAELAKKLAFTKDGLLIWSSLDRIGLKAERVSARPSLNFLKEHEGKVILKLAQAPINHWVALEDARDDNTLYVMDPLVSGGGMAVKSWSKVLSYTKFEAINHPQIEFDPVPNWTNVAGNKNAKEIWLKAKEKGYISKETNFHEPKSAGEMMIYLARLFPEKF